MNAAKMADVNAREVKRSNGFSIFGKGMLAGAVAGAAGKTTTAPIDRIKMIYQVRNAPHFLEYSNIVKLQIEISCAGGSTQDFYISRCIRHHFWHCEACRICGSLAVTNT